MNMDMKKTAVLIASPKEDRYSNKAVRMLLDNNVEVVPIGYRTGLVQNIEIIVGRPEVENLHTLTLYLNPKNQKVFYDYILGLKPKRVIFNPGTENEELQKMLDEQDISWEEACTLVLLSTNQF